MNDLDEIRQWLDNPSRPRCDPQTEGYITYLLYALNKERERRALLQTQFDELSQLAQKFASYIQQQRENKMSQPLDAPKRVEVYYDAEFTGLHQNTTPISMGFVAETGETFYAEFTDYDKGQCNEWIEQNVIANLLYGSDTAKGISDLESDKKRISHINFGIKHNSSSIKEMLELWLSQFDQVQIVSDVAHYDFVLFVQLWGHAFNLPSHVSPTCHDINQDIAGFLGISEAEAFNINREKFCGLVAGDGDKHNALWDARVIKACRHKMLLPRKVEVSDIKITSYDSTT